MVSGAFVIRSLQYELGLCVLCTYICTVQLVLPILSFMFWWPCLLHESGRGATQWNLSWKAIAQDYTKQITSSDKRMLCWISVGALWSTSIYGLFCIPAHFWPLKWGWTTVLTNYSNKSYTRVTFQYSSIMAMDYHWVLLLYVSIIAFQNWSLFLISPPLLREISSSLSNSMHTNHASILYINTVGAREWNEEWGFVLAFLHHPSCVYSYTSAVWEGRATLLQLFPSC